MLAKLLLASFVLYNVLDLSNGFIHRDRLMNVNLASLSSYLDRTSNLSPTTNKCEHFWLQMNLATESYRSKVDSQNRQFDVAMSDFNQALVFMRNLQRNDLTARLMDFMQMCNNEFLNLNGPISGGVKQMVFFPKSIFEMEQVIDRFSFLSPNDQCSHFWFAAHKLYYKTRPALMQNIDLNDLSIIQNWLQNNQGGMNENKRQKVLSFVKNCRNGNYAHVGSDRGLSGDNRTYQVNNIDYSNGVMNRDFGFDPLILIGIEFLTNLGSRYSRMQMDQYQACQWLASELRMQLDKSLSLEGRHPQSVQVDNYLLEQLHYALRNRVNDTSAFTFLLKDCANNDMLSMANNNNVRSYTQVYETNQRIIPNYISDIAAITSSSLNAILISRNFEARNLSPQHNCARIWKHLRGAIDDELKSATLDQALRWADPEDLRYLADHLESKSLAAQNHIGQLRECYNILTQARIDFNLGPVPDILSLKTQLRQGINYAEHHIEHEFAPVGMAAAGLAMGAGMVGSEVNQSLRAGKQYAERELHEVAQPYEAVAHAARAGQVYVNHEMNRVAAPIEGAVHMAAQGVRHEFYPVETAYHAGAQVLNNIESDYKSNIFNLFGVVNMDEIHKSVNVRKNPSRKECADLIGLLSKKLNGFETLSRNIPEGMQHPISIESMLLNDFYDWIRVNENYNHGPLLLHVGKCSEVVAETARNGGQALYFRNISSRSFLPSRKGPQQRFCDKPFCKVIMSKISKHIPESLKNELVH